MVGGARCIALFEQAFELRTRDIVALISFPGSTFKQLPPDEAQRI